MVEFLKNFGTLLGVLGLLVTVAVYLYGTSRKGRQDIIRQDNTDLRASNQELRTEKAGYVATITQQSDTIKNLRDVATQTPAVTQLLELSSRQQAITQKQHGEVMEQLSHVATEMSKMTTAIAKAFQVEKNK